MLDTLDGLRREGEVVSAGKFFLVEQITRIKLIIAVRTGEPYTSLLQVEESFANAIKTFPYMREHWNLLTDLRDAPMRTDAAFERLIRRMRPEMVRGFLNHAILVRTAVGSLQVSRHSQESGTGGLVTQSTSEALEHLGITGVVSQPPQPDKPSEA